MHNCIDRLLILSAIMTDTPLPPVAADEAPHRRIVIRDACDADIAAVQRVYAHYVAQSLSTFEETPPSVDEMRRRWQALAASGLPYLVALVDGDVAGYAYASSYRARSAYRYTVENSVYVDRRRLGQGVGTALLRELINRCARGPWRQMIAVVGDSSNTASIALHERLGFRRIGTLSSVGFKHQKWVDTVLMQRELWKDTPDVGQDRPPGAA